MGRASDVQAPKLKWPELLATLRANHTELYRNWFDDLEPGELLGGQLRVTTKDPAQARFLRERCTTAFNQAAMALTGHLISVQFASGSEPEDFVSRPHSLTRAPLNPDYTFEEFVVGASNRLAHAACRAICNEPGSLYNPLFIHGSSGLGKSHLMQATCDALLRNKPNAQIAYVSCETFVNDFVRAIEAGSLSAFRESARGCDLLVIDDVQFLANRESSQEELFHTFNALYQARRQIVLSADVLPAEIPTLEDRLVSRFTWGLVAQLDPPDRETRQAILQKKARLHGIEVPPEALDYLAEKVASNIRLLEGALTKLITQAKLLDREIDLALAKEIAPGFEPVEQRPILIEEIVNVVADHFGVKARDIHSRKRTRTVSHPRHIAMYLARKVTGLSLGEVGEKIGNRDHSTVLHAQQTIERDIEKNAELRHLIDVLAKRLTNRGSS